MLQKVICINERKAVPRQMQIEVGKAYFLDLSTINGDFEGDWYGNVYAEEKKETYIGHLKLSHFRSEI